MAPLKVVCLISGGKDSLFSILHCLKNDHEVVALANLHPPYITDNGRGTEEDSDSYMYQTIGHAVVPLYEKALGLPLYRQAISGTHINQNKSYSAGSIAGEDGEDETESLIPLLQKVKFAHPEVNALSSGAILSDYQRTRVESVALRLGLTPLAYLWQWPILSAHSQSSLLEDMAAVGQDSRIVKVASGGLDESFLWANVADRRTIRRLEKAASRFGSPNDGAVLGEGGEYETLAVTGPAPLWKGRICVDEEDRRVVPSGAGAAHLQVSRPRFEETEVTTGNTKDLRMPPLLEPQFKRLLDILTSGEDRATRLKSTNDTMAEATCSISSTTLNDLLLEDLVGHGASPADQARAIMDQAQMSLANSGHSLNDVAYTSIILRDMADFTSVNAIYGAYFREPNPPARVTVTCAAVLPKDKDVMISMTSIKHRNHTHRQGLHVQSLSYWAPANIGPYSQAISVALQSGLDVDDGSVVYIAGQIPLVPSTMHLTSPQDVDGAEPFLLQTVLALQHATRIGRVMKVEEWACAIAFINTASPEDIRLRSNIVHQAWEELRRWDAISTDEGSPDEDHESFDVWDARFGSARQSDKQPGLNRLSLQDRTTALLDPPLYVVKVDALPRGADVEFAMYGLTTASKAAPRIRHFEHLLKTFGLQRISPIN